MNRGTSKLLSILALGLASLAPQAKAAWVGPFIITDGAGKVARAWEQVSLFPGAPVLYQFLVQNISPGGMIIDGVYFGVGARAAAVGGGMQYSNLAGGADAVFPASPGPFNNGQPLWNNANNGQFLNLAPMAGWGFEEFDDRNIATAPFPNTSYVIRWYEANPLGPNGIPFGGVRYFWLTSNFGPVPGGGGIDPLGPGSIIGFDEETGGVQGPPVDITSPEVTECTSGCDTTDFSFATPEPASMSLAGGALILLGLGIRRQRSKK